MREEHIAFARQTAIVDDLYQLAGILAGAASTVAAGINGIPLNEEYVIPVKIILFVLTASATALSAIIALLGLSEYPLRAVRAGHGLAKILDTFRFQKAEVTDGDALRKLEYETRSKGSRNLERPWGKLVRFPEGASERTHIDTRCLIFKKAKERSPYLRPCDNPAIRMIVDVNDVSLGTTAA